MNYRRWLIAAAIGAALVGPQGSRAFAQDPGFYPADVAPGGVVTINAKDTYYDGSDGILSGRIPLPAGATKLEFRVTGGVSTDNSSNLAAPDGIYSDGNAHYNFTNTRFAGTYQGTPLGSSTGSDPALFGVFFSAAFSGTPADSLNYRSDSGIVPDPRTLASYSPSSNQPFFVGDGYTGDNGFATTDDSLIPAGSNQTFDIPSGTQYLLLGIGADPGLADNVGSTFYTVHVFSDALQAVTPLFSLPSGSYFGAQQVIISTPTPGATIHYTTDGSDPSQTDPTVASGSSLTVSTTTTLKARAFEAGFTPSGISSASYSVGGAGAGFYTADVGDNGALTVNAQDTYYDGSDGSLFAKIPLPPGATELRFRVTGAVTTDGSNQLVSPDGIFADGTAHYNDTNTHFSGTYQGVALGGTTGIDPALFGVFFSPTFVGTPADSLNFRSDSGIVPDPRTLLSYTPSVNQPFFVGDGFSANNAYTTTADNILPSGSIQTFTIPSGCSYLLLGLGADPQYSDNSPSTFFTVHVYDNVQAALSPQFSPDGGAFFGPKQVTITTATPGATIHYTTSGADPTESDPVIPSGDSITVSQSLTLKARAFDAGLEASQVQSAEFVIGDAGTGFYPAALGTNGVITVDSHNTYYDGSNGILSTKIPLPPGATKLRLRVTGGVITDGSDQLASPDGLYASGQVPYNWTNTQWNGTYQGVPIGSTTGIDPALCGVFFNPAFTGTPQGSDNYRSDSGIIPDPRTLQTYTPAQNQPFWVGDGFSDNNAFVTSDNTYLPSGQMQTYDIPAGAQYLLLGIGADPNMGDNQNAQNRATAFTVHVYDDVPPAGQIVSPGDLPNLPDGAVVTVTAEAHTSGGAAGSGNFYMEDRSVPSGIRVEGATAPVPEAHSVTVTGTLGTNADHERIIQASSIVDNGNQAPVVPFVMANKNAGGASSGASQGVTGGTGLYNVGLLVKTTGTVSNVNAGTGQFQITDGSPTPILVKALGLTLPSNGDYVTVQGAASLIHSGSSNLPVLIVTSQAEITN